MATGALVGIAALAPWHRSGRVHRNAFALAHATERLGLVTGAPRRILFVSVYLLPLLAALALLAAIDRRTRIVGGLCVLAGVVGIVGAIVLLRTPGMHQTGPKLACVAAPVAIAIGVRVALIRSVR